MPGSILVHLPQGDTRKIRDHLCKTYGKGCKIQNPVVPLYSPCIEKHLLFYERNLGSKYIYLAKTAQYHMFFSKRIFQEPIW